MPESLKLTVIENDESLEVRFSESKVGATTGLAQPAVRAGCANGFWRLVRGRPIEVPLAAIRETTKFGHSVDIFRDPPGAGLLESVADPIFRRTLHHPTAD